ncbi:hypothetical protein N7540_002495 [Penicillium herquei]|nr:hypothetical protein N7540_002495 [Penicillium herquei]
MPGNRKAANFNALDAAAAAEMLLLRKAHVPHFFQGAYTISLIGGNRITEVDELSLLSWPVIVSLSLNTNYN